MVNQYSRGRNLEYATRDLLIEQGFWVMRSAGSKTVVDLIALREDHALMVQCKLRGLISPDERKELLRVAKLIQAVPVVASKVAGSSEILFHQLTGDGPKEREPFDGVRTGSDRRRCLSPEEMIEKGMRLTDQKIWAEKGALSWPVKPSDASDCLVAEDSRLLQPESVLHVGSNI